METARLILRRFRREDWQDLYEYLSDPEVVAFEPYQPCSREECREIAAKRADNEAFWAVCLKESGKVIGNLYFQGGDFATWELGYVFNATFQGQGFASESTKALVDHAFAQLDARRIIAKCDPQNARSWRLLERLGFRREAHFHQNVAFWQDQQGRPIWKDTYVYAILAHEWI